MTGIGELLRQKKRVGKGGLPKKPGSKSYSFSRESDAKPPIYDSKPLIYDAKPPIYDPKPPIYDAKPLVYDYPTLWNKIEVLSSL